MYKEDLDNGFIDVVIVQKKLKSNFSADVLDIKKGKSNS